MVSTYKVLSGDFAVVEDRHSGGGEEVIDDAELEAILSEDSCRQNQDELSESWNGYQYFSVFRRNKYITFLNHIFESSAASPPTLNFGQTALFLMLRVQY
nr:Mariner Mos1 transposase [Hymenolepis microstoma]